MAQPTVLITGVSGFIGAKVVVDAIQAGYAVRGVVRKAQQIDLLNSLIAGVSSVDAEFIVIPDLLAEDAFRSDVLDGITYIIHIASPLPKPTDNYERDYFIPAYGITINILKAAANTPSVKRVVITSTIGVILNPVEYAKGHFSREYHSANLPIQKNDPKYPYPVAVLAYGASKTNAHLAAEDFMQREKPTYDLVMLMPTLVLGRHLLARNQGDLLAVTSLAPMLGLLTGKNMPFPLLGSSVHVDDVARAHINALRSEAPAGRYILAGGAQEGVEWMGAVTIAKNSFPEAWEKELSVQGKIQSIPVKFDVEDSQKYLDMKYQGFEAQVKDTITQYLELQPQA